MSLPVWLQEKFADLNLTFLPEDLFPHPNVALWLKKTANRYLPATPAQVGILIMPHGATQPHNDAVERVIAPLQEQYPVELA